MATDFMFRLKLYRFRRYVLLIEISLAGEKLFLVSCLFWLVIKCRVHT